MFLTSFFFLFQKGHFLTKRPIPGHFISLKHAPLTNVKDLNKSKKPNTVGNISPVDGLDATQHTVSHFKYKTPLNDLGINADKFYPLLTQMMRMILMLKLYRKFRKRNHLYTRSQRIFVFFRIKLKSNLSVTSSKTMQTIPWYHLFWIWTLKIKSTK